jgi:hypothetical protein
LFVNIGDGGIFCDLAEAFDGINHRIFLAKRYFCDILGVSEGLFRSYLTNGRESVEIKPRSAIQNFFPHGGTQKYSVPKSNFVLISLNGLLLICI